MIKQVLKEKLERVPNRPGCYLFKDKKGNILYVGKAGSLRNRVRSYFQLSRSSHPKLEALVSHIEHIEWIVTDSEVEALILENNLIKENKPRYNIDLKDDKSYPYIRITREDFPRVFITRTLVQDGSEYFGPYTNVKNVRFTLKTLKRLFPLRSCKYDLNPRVIEDKKVQLCLDYYIKKCKGPCQGLQSRAEYGQMIDQVRQFLKGKTQAIVNQLKTEMARLSDQLEYEEAARVRDRIEILENYRNTQKVVMTDFKDRDLVGMARDGDNACAVIFKIREGKIINRIHFFMKKIAGQSDSEILDYFLNHYYLSTEDIPQDILVSEATENQKILEKFLNRKSAQRVHFIHPQIGDKKKLIEMTVKNARYLIEEIKLQQLKAKEYVPHSVASLQRDLRLNKLPRRIECFDISNIQGSDPVASMVCFVNGKPKKSEYRKFKIQSKETPDDFAMMQEALTRRYRRVLDEKQEMPDLIVVDGGKGQLSSALMALARLGLDGKKLPILGLAKRLEEVFIPGIKDSIMLPRTSSSLKLLQQIRNEAHRFAITFHRQRRSKRTLQSELDAIPGIGPHRKKALLTTFGSVKKIKDLSREDLSACPSIPPKIAEAIFNHFHPGR